MKKVVSIIVLLIAINCTGCTNESKGNATDPYSSEYTPEELVRMNTEFYSFRNELIKRLQKLDSVKNLKDTFYKGFFKYENDFKNKYITFKNDSDFKEISKYLDVQILKEVLKNGQLVKYKGRVTILSSNNKNWSPDKYPDITFYYNSELKKWQFTSIRYIKL